MIKVFKYRQATLVFANLHFSHFPSTFRSRPRVFGIVFGAGRFSHPPFVPRHAVLRHKHSL
ncbi:hypothetical protein BDN72DRAFT_39915 [Pluteus cervinus]|uniref:Uncharacterized protein n=1 Tax=Pluteus cervinus TaxID=181527 RepID=A0ACD3BIB4_9AGAR|nr:hypothetical protein BDN72DRAFT_39915 [Pluteus cervinus]